MEKEQAQKADYEGKLSAAKGSGKAVSASDLLKAKQAEKS